MSIKDGWSQLGLETGSFSHQHLWSAAASLTFVRLSDLQGCRQNVLLLGRVRHAASNCYCWCINHLIRCGCRVVEPRVAAFQSASWWCRWLLLHVGGWVELRLFHVNTTPHLQREGHQLKGPWPLFIRVRGPHSAGRDIICEVTYVMSAVLLWPLVMLFWSFIWIIFSSLLSYS